MFDSILVPTDGSGGMERVTERAIALAECGDGSIHALYVVDEAAYGAVPEDARDRVRDTLRSDGEDATRTVAQRAIDAGLEAEREIRWGDPAVAIVAYAVENDVDTIVMGTRGKSGFERYLLGSVAEKVVRVSPVPVLTVRIGDREELTEEVSELLGT